MIFIFVIGAIGAALHGDFSGIEAIFSFLGVVLVLVFGFWLIYKIGLLGASIVLNIMWIIPFLIIKNKKSNTDNKNNTNSSGSNLEEWKRNK